MQGGSIAVAAGDWDDVEASISVAAGRSQMAVESIARPGPDRIVAALVTIRDEPVRLGATLRADGSILFECTVGRFGRPDSERELLRAVTRRLSDLHGRDSAPVR